MREIAEGVAELRGMGMREFMTCASHRVAHARYEAMWEMRQAGRSYPQIGEFFGRDHTTVLHGVRVHERRLQG
jgi:chromosomal replication initiation ATPase DnaA